jgi:sugar lactone lactonase YvrE
MKWTQWFSTALPAGLLVMAGCADKDPVSSTPVAEDLAAGKLVISNRAGGGRSVEYGFPKEIALPAGWRPEGIEIGRGTTFYVGSIGTGSIYRGDLRTGEGEVLVTGPGTPTRGVFYEERGNRLFAANGADKGYVYDADTGEQLGAYTFANGKLINDVVVTQDAAYFTDSLQPLLYVVPLGSAGELPAANGVETLELVGDYRYDAAAPSPRSINNNGIVATPDGKQLIVINMGTKTLYLVDPASGVCRTIQLDEPLPAPQGDGLDLQGRDLYVVMNAGNKVVQIRLAPDFASGVVTRTITSPRFDIPTTIAVFGNSLYAVNARVTTPPESTTPYSVVRVPR